MKAESPRPLPHPDALVRVAVGRMRVKSLALFCPVHAHVAASQLPLKGSMVRGGKAGSFDRDVQPNYCHDGDAGKQRSSGHLALGGSRSVGSCARRLIDGGDCVGPSTWRYN